MARTPVPPGPPVSRRAAMRAGLGVAALGALTACDGSTPRTAGDPPGSGTVERDHSSSPPRPRVPTSGQAMPRGDLKGWTQVIAEDFDTDVPLGGFVATENGILASTCSGYPAYGDRFGVYWDGPSGDGGLYRADRTLSATKSLLDIHVHHDASLKKLMCAAFFPFRPGTTSNLRTYGRWSYRMRSYGATAPGITSVSLLFPELQSQWPESGEMDWPESDVSGMLGGNNHPAGFQDNPSDEIPTGARLWSDWHTFTIDWRKDSLTYFVDDVATLTTTQHVPDEPLKWDTQCAPTAGFRGELLVGVSAHIQLDWVVAYDPV